jgi:hypothetical protein
MKRGFFVIALLFCISANAEPLIRSFFPKQDLMLGQPLIWIVEIRYPMWESYEVRFGNCGDVEMKIANQTLTDVAGELKAVYRIAVAPISLHLSCAPTLMISDEKGLTTILKGRSFRVHTISGDSEEIRAPHLPDSIEMPRGKSTVLAVALAMLVLLGTGLIVKRIYNNTPRQKFLRDIRRAIQEVEKKRVPIQVWRLLRSEMVWGFSADAFTPSQLSQKALQSPKLLAVAAALQSLEKWRYSGSRTSYDAPLLIQALGYAGGIVDGNKNRRSA